MTSVLKQAPICKDTFETKTLYARFGKRMMDITLSVPALLMLVPLGIFIALLVKITSPGPIFYLQDRVGKEGRIFKIIKFRTMVTGNSGPKITSGNDPRITSFGRFLRRIKLDELPQLWNVVNGEMSIIGPRPEVESYVAGYNAEQQQVLRIRPGITDLASILYRCEEALLAESPDPERFYREIVLPHKLSINLQYLRNISLTRDLRLMAQTVWAVLSTT